MKTNIRWRVAIVLAVVTIALWHLYPTLRWTTLSPERREELTERWKTYERPAEERRGGEKIRYWLERKLKGSRQETINLGLDLQGGMHLVLEVSSQKAVENDLVRLKSSLERELADERLAAGYITVEETSLVVDCGSAPADKVREAAKDTYRRFDIESMPENENILILSLPDKEVEEIKDITVRQELEIIRNRIDEFGVAEPVIQRQSDDRILIQLPGVTDPERVIDIIGRTAELKWHLVVDRAPTEEQLLNAYEGQTPDDTFVAFTAEDPRVPTEPKIAYLLRTEAGVTGADLKNAWVGHDSNLRPAVHFEMNTVGARAFSILTQEHINEELAILLDGKVHSAPRIRGRIIGQGIIEGNFTLQEAQDLAIVLRSGALPAEAKIIEERTVGPTLGSDSVRKGVIATLLGLGLVFVFMAGYYRFGGLVADLALILNIIIIMAALAGLHATLTLPGIAGIILTIGMAVDANVLIFERIREEVKKGKTLRTSIDAGYSKAFLTILDANVTTLITAIVLFQFGTGPVRGFAMTLTIGILASMFTALVVTRVIFDILTQRRTLTKLAMAYLVREPDIGFIGLRKLFFVLSSVCIILGMVAFGVRGRDNLGIDFAHGIVQQLRFQQPTTTGEVRYALSRADMGQSIVQQYGSERDILIRTSASDSEDEDQQSLIEKMDNALREDFGGEFEILRTEMVGPTVSKDLTRQAQLALFYAMIGILFYIAWRFSSKLMEGLILSSAIAVVMNVILMVLPEINISILIVLMFVIVFYLAWLLNLNYAVAAIAALFHDVLITVGAFALPLPASRELSLPVVAALLTIIGYSLNDTIVVFDRIRENLRLMRGKPYAQIINTSINQTLGRTLLTSFTSLVVVGCLYFFGGEVINDFSFALLVGIMIGTYSSIYIASPILVEWQRRTRRKD